MLLSVLVVGFVHFVTSDGQKVTTARLVDEGVAAATDTAAAAAAAVAAAAPGSTSDDAARPATTSESPAAAAMACVAASEGVQRGGRSVCDMNEAPGWGGGIASYAPKCP
jgi:hypothetical protein